MSKFDELEAAISASNIEAATRDHQDVKMMKVFFDEFGSYLECPKGALVALPIEPNRDIGETYIARHVIRAHDGWALAKLGLNLPSGPVELHVQIRSTGVRVTSKCFGVADTWTEQDRDVRAAHYGRVFSAIKDYLATRHDLTPDLIAERRRIGFLDPECPTKDASFKDDNIASGGVG